MVTGDALVISALEAAALPGDQWCPLTDSGGVSLRTPIAGTLDALIAKHQAFLNRIQRDVRGNNSFNPVPPLSAFKVVGYRRAIDPPQRPFATFGILKPDVSGFRAFDTVRRGVLLAGMMRCAAKKAARIAGPSGTPLTQASAKSLKCS